MWSTIHLFAASGHIICAILSLYFVTRSISRAKWYSVNIQTMPASFGLTEEFYSEYKANVKQAWINGAVGLGNLLLAGVNLWRAAVV